MKVQKRPVVVDAVKYDGSEQSVVDILALSDEGTNTISIASDGIYINTLEGKMHASVGDWIIKGVNGECYPCKDEIFRKTYDVDVKANLEKEERLEKKIEEQTYDEMLERWTDLLSNDVGFRMIPVAIPGAQQEGIDDFRKKRDSLAEVIIKEIRRHSTIVKVAPKHLVNISLRIAVKILYREAGSPDTNRVG